jgi:hypothetical protein
MVTFRGRCYAFIDGEWLCPSGDHSPQAFDDAIETIEDLKQQIEQLEQEIEFWETAPDQHQSFQGGPHPCCKCEVCSDRLRLMRENDRLRTMIRQMVDAAVDHVNRGGEYD